MRNNNFKKCMVLTNSKKKNLRIIKNQIIGVQRRSYTMRKKTDLCKHHKEKIKGLCNYLSLFSVHKKRHVLIFQKLSKARPAEALGKRLID